MLPYSTPQKKINEIWLFCGCGLSRKQRARDWLAALRRRVLRPVERKSSSPLPPKENLTPPWKNQSKIINELRQVL